MRDQLNVPEEKPYGTHIHLKDDMGINLSWSEYSPKTKQDKAIEMAWESIEGLSTISNPE